MSEIGSCVLCTSRTSGSLEFCRNCYNEYKADITNKKPWVRAVKNENQRDRRRREKQQQFGEMSLDAILDFEFARNTKDRRW